MKGKALILSLRAAVRPRHPPQTTSRFLSCSFVKIFARGDDPTPFSAPGIVDVCDAHGWGQSLQTTVDHTLMRGLGTA